MKKDKKDKNLFDKIEMLQNPLLTEDGFLNEACMNELSGVIKNMPKSHDRLSNRPEWNVKKWTFLDDITGAFAKYSISQSPYNCPDNLEEVVNYLATCLERDVDWGECGMVKLSLCEISKLLYDILYEKGITYFDNWNKPKKGGDVECVFVSRYGKPDPDYNIIDLDALLYNVCSDIRLERREADKSHKEFEEKYGKEEG